MYNTCGHGCLYCYANYDNNTVRSNMKKHDPDSPFLIGNYQKDDIIIDVDQSTWVNRQISLFGKMKMPPACDGIFAMQDVRIECQCCR